MGGIVFESVSKMFRHRPALFNWIGNERSGASIALENVSLNAAPGRILVLLGPNGSGKTTTLKLISSILLPDSGRVLIGGADTKTDSVHARRQVGFAVANERSFFPRLSARENLDFFAALEDIPRAQRPKRIAEVLESVDLMDAADTLVMKFSSGMYQRLAIARALIKDPAILLFDEPTRSLDPASAMQFWELVRELPRQGKTVLLASHNFAEAANVGDSVAVLQHGKIVGRRDIRYDSAEQLRSFYFHVTGEVKVKEKEEFLLVAGA
jgi:ABC-2 type transport system ATP-binding protein